MPDRRRSSNSEGSQPKRAKLFRACDSCVSSKTRCDDLTAEGCSLCRKKNRVCSLLHQAPEVNLEEETRMVKGRMDVVEARVWEFELRLRAVEESGGGHVPRHAGPAGLPDGLGIGLDGGVLQPAAAPGPAPASVGVPSSSSNGTATRTMDGSLSGSGIATGISMTAPSLPTPLDDEGTPDLAVLKDMDKTYYYQFDERAFSLKTSAGFPDAIKRDLVTREQLVMAFQLWKHRFATVLPLAPFLLASTPVPSHPFVVAAILIQSKSTTSTRIAHLVNECISYALTGAIDADVILALLILSVNPGHHLVPSRCRLISMAYEIGKSLGWETNEQAALDTGDMITQPWWRERFGELVIWEAVKMQYNLTHLCMTRFSTLVPTSIDRFPYHPQDQYRMSVSYLAKTSAILETFIPFIRDLAKAESMGVYGQVDYDSLLKIWPAMQDRLKAQREKLGLKDLSEDPTSFFVEFGISLRMIRFYQRLPFPVHPDFKNIGTNTIGSELLRIGAQIVDWFNDLDIETNPPLSAMVLQVVAGAVTTIMATYAVVQKMFAHIPGLIIGPARKAEDKIYALGGPPADIMRQTRESFFADLEKSSDNDTSAYNVDFGDLDLLNTDFSAWSWLFTSQPPPAEEGAAGASAGADPTKCDVLCTAMH